MLLTNPIKLPRFGCWRNENLKFELLQSLSAPIFAFLFKKLTALKEMIAYGLASRGNRYGAILTALKRRDLSHDMDRGCVGSQDAKAKECIFQFF